MNRYKNAVAAIGFSLLAMGAQANLVTNGSFSAGLTDWSDGHGGGSVTVVLGEALLEHGTEYIYQTQLFAANTSYVLTFTSGGTGTGWVDFYQNDIPVNGSSEPVTFTGAGQHTFNFTTGSSDVYTKLEFASATGSIASITVDNISITSAVPEPESWAMLLVGLTAMGSMAGRRKARQTTG